MDQPHSLVLLSYARHNVGFVLAGYLWDVAIFFGWPVCGDPREGDPTKSVGNQRLGNVVYHLMRCLNIPWRADNGVWGDVKATYRWFRDSRREAREVERVRREVERFSGLKLRGESLILYLEWLAEQAENKSSPPRRD